MKFKILVLMLAVALSSLAQTAATTAPTTKQDSKSCACCKHDKAASGAKACCSGCCKDGQCPMMSGNHAGMKCPMMSKDEKMADGKMCCSSNKCPMHAKGGKGCCCVNMDEQKQQGI